LGLSGITAIAGGDSHSLALKSDDTVWAWGYNIQGQLGNGTDTNSNVPAKVFNLTEIIAIAGGGCYSLALKMTERSGRREITGQVSLAMVQLIAATSLSKFQDLQESRPSRLAIIIPSL
jgi:alpha-tubulin suppressor-like RCC1 family protein